MQPVPPDHYHISTSFNSEDTKYICIILKSNAWTVYDSHMYLVWKHFLFVVLMAPTEERCIGMSLPSSARAEGELFAFLSIFMCDFLFTVLVRLVGKNCTGTIGFVLVWFFSLHSGYINNWNTFSVLRVCDKRNYYF